MFVHPFHEIAPIVPDSTPPPRGKTDSEAPSERWRGTATPTSTPAVRLGRRGFFASAIAGAVGLAAFLAGRQADAWPWWRWRFERGGYDPRNDRDAPNHRDLDRRSGEGMRTTLALGEEGGERRPPRPPRERDFGPREGDERITTQALGEEGSERRPPRERVTTYALGEEGSGDRRPRDPFRPGPITTQALGEEG